MHFFIFPRDSTPYPFNCKFKLLIIHLLLLSDYSLHGFKESVRGQVAQHPGPEEAAGQVSDDTTLQQLLYNTDLTA